MADGLDTTIAFILAIASVIIGVVLGVVAHRAYEAFRHRGRRIYQPRVFRGQFMKQKEFEQLQSRDEKTFSQLAEATGTPPSPETLRAVLETPPAWLTDGDPIRSAPIPRAPPAP